MAEDNKEGSGNKDQGGDDIQALKDKIAALEKEKSEWTSKKEQDNQSLGDKVRKEQEDRDKKISEGKEMESAIQFNMSRAEFQKTHESLLPKETIDIFKMADKEHYSTAIEKANATKAALVQSFFSVQSNLELLTQTQQNNLADWLKLTKNSREDKAREIYDSLFEPALSTLKRVKKAEELGKVKQGFGGNTDADQALKDKMSTLGNKKFFRGKHGA